MPAAIPYLERRSTATLITVPEAINAALDGSTSLGSSPDTASLPVYNLAMDVGAIS